MLEIEYKNLTEIIVEKYRKEMRIPNARQTK